MADYKEAHGVRAKLVSSNPTNPTDGQLWYNSTDEALRYKKADSAGAWSTGGDLVNGRRLLAGSGTQTAGLAFGGSAVPTAYKSHTEEYNGSSWTEVGDMNTARDHTMGFGTQEDSICAGGYATTDRTTKTELWNGTSWTEVNDLNEGRQIGAAAGASTTSAGLYFGGWGPGDIDKTEEFNSVFTVTTE